MKKVLGIILIILSSLLSFRSLQGIVYFILDFDQISGSRIYVAVYSMTLLLILLIALGVGILLFRFGLKLVKRSST